jgi:hypothetical protein
MGSIVLLGGILIGFNQCVNPINPSSSNKNSSTSNSTQSSGVTVSKAVMVEAFSKSVYPVTRARCMGCHDTGQTPLLASSDVNVAYDSIMNASKMDMSNPGNSRLVLKLLNEHHNCWGICSDNASEIQSKIEQMISLMGSSSNSTPVANNTYGKTTKESTTITEVLNPTSNYDENTVHLMAESASLKTPMSIAKDGDVSYVYVPNGVANKDLTSADAGIAYLNFSLLTSDFYRIYAYVNAASDTASSVYVKAAGSDYKEWTIGATKGFEWKIITNTPAKLDTEFYMSTGKSYTLEFRQKNSGIMISKVAITNDLFYDPTEVPKALLKATIEIPINDLTGVSDAKLEIDIEDFDMYSYKVSNPRIVSSKNLLVKKMKVLVNGNFNPQHATYLSINKTITSIDNSLSAASMILLKDKGADFDKLSFAFDTIEVAK